MLAGEYSINAKLLYGLLLNRTTLSLSLIHISFHKRPAGIHNQIALEKTILYAVCDDVIA